MKKRQTDFSKFIFETCYNESGEDRIGAYYSELIEFFEETRSMLECIMNTYKTASIDDLECIICINLHSFITKERLNARVVNAIASQYMLDFIINGDKEE